MNTDRYVRACPYCGGTEMIEAYQGGYGALSSRQSAFASCSLNHIICRRCGSVVRSYVDKPEKLLKRKDRKKNTD